MRRSALLSVVIVFLAAAVFAATASASTTYHGEFTSATGMLKTEHHLRTIDASGTWSVNVGLRGTQITGHAFVYHFHTDIVPLTGSSPTGGEHNATWLVTWTDITWSRGVLTAHGTATIETYMPGKSVGLTFRLDPTAATPVKLHVDLSTNYVSEAGWLYWDITGDLSP
jgi:hypothetical protein